MPRELRPVLLPLLDSTTQLSETKLWSRDFSRAWHSQSRQLCFLGDAAHPMCSTFGYGTSLAFEDAVVLARVAASAGSLDSFVTEGVRTFEAARLDRVRTVVEINREAALSRHAGASNAEFAGYATKLEQYLKEHPL